MAMTPTSFQLIAALVRRETAMVYDTGKEYLVEARLLPLAAAAGCADVDSYIARVTVDPTERRKALDVLTINETSWFRDLAPYTAFTEHMLPHLMERCGATRHIRIWSAACSSGQEAYSLAMLLDQHLPAGWTAEIVATDVSTAMLERVRRGRYSQVEMNRGMPATTLVRYFSRAGSEWEIVPHLREVVRAHHLNLAEPFAGQGVLLGTFDLVLIRNVLIYFDQQTKYDILRRIRDHVAGHGYLLLGSTETTLDMPAEQAASWRVEQLGRVQAHRPAVAVPHPATTEVPRLAALAPLPTALGA